jgi:Complex I intermediate-associated protein 30 (CIA30)
MAWNLSRFIKTLSYFGAIPLLSRIDWFQHMLGSQPDPTVNRSTITDPGIILVVGAPERLEQQLVQRLTRQGYQVRSHPLGSTPLPRDKVQAAICWIQDGIEPVLETVAEAIAQFPHPSEQRLFDFAHPASDVREIWGALDDVVMGGVSESNIRLQDNAALFSGNVSTANSGGFASVRTRNFTPPLDLANAEGIELRVKGDGNRYKFMLRSENRWDGIAYCYSFDTLAHDWTTVRIPFSALIPVFRAKTVSGADPIDTHTITAVQLMLSKFEYDGALNPTFTPGPFQLQIESICTYRTEPLPRLVLVGTSTFNLEESSIPHRGIPYTIVQTAALVNEPDGRSLIVNPTDLADKTVSYGDVAELCGWAIAHSQACCTQFSVAAGDGPCAPRDWDCLFKSIPTP